MYIHSCTYVHSIPNQAPPCCAKYMCMYKIGSNNSYGTKIMLHWAQWYMYVCISTFTVSFYLCIIDIDECAPNNGGCQHTCNNINGSFYCTCNDGYTLNRDGKSCTGM